METESRQVLINTENSIRSLESSLKSGSFSIGSSSFNKEMFNRDEFWSQMPLLIQNCSKECTKFCLAFSSHPLPGFEASNKLCEQMENSVFTVASLFSLVPQSEGKRFYKYLQAAVLAIVESTADLVKVTTEGPESAKKQLQNTGTLWEACEKALKLPKDNRETIIIQLDECSAMVKDAYTELDECRKVEQCSSHEDDDTSEPEHQLSDNEKLMLAPCLNLIKASMASLTKILHSLGDKSILSPANQLDSLSDAIDLLSPAVDNLASCFFMGSSTDTVDQQAVELCTTLKCLLAEFRKSSYFTPADEKRADFLELAADHNLAKLQDVTKVLLNVLAC